MKRLLRGLTLILVIFLFSGCMGKIHKISYTDFNEYFSNKKGFTIKDSTGSYDIKIRRYLESGNGDFQISYIEFDNEKNAENYLKTMYSDTNKYKIKHTNNYIFIKSNKPSYFRLYKKENVIVSGITKDKKARKEVKRVLKDLLH